MKITVFDNGIMRVEGSTFAEEKELRDRLCAEGVSCTPIEFEGSADECFKWLIGDNSTESDDNEYDYESFDDIDYDDDDYDSESDDDDNFYDLW